MLDGGASRTWYLAYAAGLKEAEDAGYRSPLANASKSKRSALPEIPRPTKQWVDGQLVDCDEANQEDMEAGVLQMHGELEHDHETTAQENRDGKAFITGEPVSEASVASHPSAKPQTQDQPQDQPKDQDTPARYTPGQLINCDDSNQEDMEAGILQMYNELEQQKDSASLQPEVVKQSGDFEIKRRNRIGISGSPRLRQRARG
jgi:hypothetical protein